MIRPAVSIVLAVVLVGVATGALSATETERSVTHVEGEIDRLERAAADLVASSTAVAGIDSAGRVPVTVTVPDSGISSARIDRVRLGCPVSVPSEECPPWQASYRLPDGTARQLSVDGPRLRTADGPLVFGPGKHRLSLVYVRTEDDRPAVIVSRRGA
ncbi:putative pilin/flagellin [Halalkaliarchaeum sp. AArc-CO]|uniref:DUF7311 family protein n=1 Tax=unclassified Halalkaliarchaeum TaxID=2678344 RepID=UPI00217DF5EC|nr:MULTISPECIES: hypothetical protein [unclassified Halalkaliarchaeum]MDR5673360.1 hypothetical protein [Halalkaliarchaeum sp. AArc-GB]UWG49702.1 putative pilin/flagellin [Halalkaliarchaeum sp. AArc-CO]